MNYFKQGCLFTLLLISSATHAFEKLEKFYILASIQRIEKNNTLSVYTLGRGSRTVKIRLSGIDIPWSPNTLKYLTQLLPPKTHVYIDWESIEENRIVGRVIKDSSIDVGLELLQKGLAVPHINCTGPKCSSAYLAQEFFLNYVQACQKAQAEHRGVFDAANPILETHHEQGSYMGDFISKKLVHPQDYPQVALCQRVFFESETLANDAGFFL